MRHSILVLLAVVGVAVATASALHATQHSFVLQADTGFDAAALPRVGTAYRVLVVPLEDLLFSRGLSRLAFM